MYIARPQWQIQDLKKGGDLERPGFWGLAPNIFGVNFSHFRGLFKVFTENRGGGVPPQYPVLAVAHVLLSKEDILSQWQSWLDVGSTS